MNKKGFTLTEILIVLVVAGILLALILPNVLRAIDRGNRTADASNVHTLQTAVFMCYSELRAWDACDTQAELRAGGYLQEDVVSPYPGQNYTFTLNSDITDLDGVGVTVTSTVPAPPAAP